MTTTTIQITRQNLDAGKIIHAGWNLGSDVTDDCGVNVHDYFDLSGRYLGPDENGLEPIFEQAKLWKITATTVDDDGNETLADRAYALGDYADETWADRDEAEDAADELRDGVGTIVDDSIVYTVEEVL